jgi:hypothetical protein
MGNKTNIELNDSSINTLVIILIRDIMTNLNINLNGVDLSDPLVNFQVPWLKALIDNIKPLYLELGKNKNIKNSSLLNQLVIELNKHNIQNNVKELFNSDVSAIEIDHLSEITELSTNLASFYDNLISNDDFKSRMLTKSNIITLITIVLYVIMFCIKKENFGEKDIRWIKVTISCLNFATVVVPIVIPEIKSKYGCFSCFSKINQTN